MYDRLFVTTVCNLSPVFCQGLEGTADLAKRRIGQLERERGELTAQLAHNEGDKANKERAAKEGAIAQEARLAAMTAQCAAIEVNARALASRNHLVGILN